MVNAAVIGYGFAGRCFHSYLIGLAKGMSVHAIATRAPERQQQAKEHYPEAKIYANMDQVLADNAVDLVVLATPHDVHAELAIQAMDAGKHVVTDKIMCMNAQEAEAMIVAGERNEVLLSIFHNRRWDWDYLTVKQVIEDGLLGDPYLYQVAIMRHGRPGGWRGSKTQSGGILFDWPAHFIDQALQLVDSPVKSVFCDIHYGDHWDIDIGNYANLILKYQNGVRYQIEIGNLAQRPKPRWYIQGNLGGLVKSGIDPQEPAMIAGNIDAAEQTPENFAQVTTMVNGAAEERVIQPVRGSWRSYYQNIADVLNHGAALIITPSQILSVMEVYDAAMESSETGDVVHLAN